VSDYQPRQQDGWPSQPPSGGAGPGGYGRGGGYGQPGYDQQAGYGPGPYDQETQATYGQQPGPPPRRRRRRHPLAWLAVVIVVLLVIAVVGDQIAKSYAQNRIAQQIQSSAQLSAKPSVSIEGWPFLTQVAAHDLKAIDFSASNITTANGKLPVSVNARATGVHPDSSFNSARVDHITGQVTITYAALDSYLGNAIGIPGLTGITFSPDPQAGPNAVKADAGVGSVVATVTKTAPAQITVKFGSLSGIASLLGGAGSIPAQVITIPKLPAGLIVGSPVATSSGVVIPASASNTTLSQ
jgi:hypothetical protein